VPTGVAMRDAREQLFAAAERVLRAAGPHALTSRAVTAEADCAKGVLHRHFADFDAFLAELVLDRIAQLDGEAAALRDRAGEGSVVSNVAGALSALLGPVALAIVALITFRDDLRARLRETHPTGVPVLTEAVRIIASYLAAERLLGRVAAGADIDTLAPTLIGAAHLLLADRDASPPDQAAIEKVVTAVLAGVIRDQATGQCSRQSGAPSGASRLPAGS
jgi:AcrR family transcriptional regulator